MKILTIITLFLFDFCNLNAQQLNCEKFKNGEFEIRKDSISKGSFISRNDSIQIERSNGSKDATELIVNWIDKCTYTLKPKDINLEEFNDLPENALLKVEIIEVKEDSYIQKSSANFADYEIIKEVYLIK
ncbi:hypothetical protein NLM59_09415 [Weeksellaceae bacterium KMM 9724]|uniref:hypothetical protein n=1 Tax=Profundicola chukchiensis TaxID=2961959 RepID=UPI00243B368D|nr:hypothetical protein [Profundicola chukchiensis]MDG4951145.1 hypothetical protein [Profundicola chukchiensis]